MTENNIEEKNKKIIVTAEFRAYNLYATFRFQHFGKKNERIIGVRVTL